MPELAWLTVKEGVRVNDDEVVSVIVALCDWLPDAELLRVAALLRVPVELGDWLWLAVGLDVRLALALES